MATEEYQVGYEAGYQDGFNAAQQPQAEPDMRKVCEALGFDPTNHHNAAKCPYCRGQQPQAEPHKPLFADLIAQHPGLREELKAMDKQPQAEAVPPDVEMVRKALDRAFTMGQSYWADADSESIRANKRSDVTRAKFLEMREEVCAVIAAQGAKT